MSRARCLVAIAALLPGCAAPPTNPTEIVGQVQPGMDSEQATAILVHEGFHYRELVELGNFKCLHHRDDGSTTERELQNINYLLFTRRDVSGWVTSDHSFAVILTPDHKVADVQRNVYYMGP
ncbi:hypothetical protein [Planctomyces sp. SH-PL14]|uniref:hypothetical protein n=1 Tax=Planctomyces sp. SH-PL14 TaxID=1632864 RepID=UPI00078B8701|nr:hypothetical protein [Planctomyces sp. SH-PL14]AMV20579.1 hypothetical protein VT03_21955 [Planctomyces sp. SH-PL14]